MTDDATLLRRYVAEKSGEAFAELVHRHLPLVYSAAARRLGGDTHRAEDVAQLVFCALARHAPRLCTHPALTGWLYTATRNEVLNILRAEKRRRIRETEAHMIQETLRETDAPADWSLLGPVLDHAMDRLADRDREAVLLRFFQGRPFAEVGALVGLSEDAARKRVDRALDKLRTHLRPHGIASTSGALAALLAHQASAALPATLAPHITGAALATGAAATAAGVGAATFFTFTKFQAAVAAVALLGGAAGLVSQRNTIAELRETQAAAEQHLARLATENAALTQTQAATTAEVARLRAQTAPPASSSDTTAPARPASSATPAAAPLRTSRASSSSTTATDPPRAASASASRDVKADLHRRYDPFLQKYGLTPAQMDRFVDLKIAIADAQADLQAAMRSNGAPGGTREIEAMRSQLVRPLWNEIYQLLGDEGRAAYGDYERTSALRLGYVEPLLPAFTAASAPLTPQQAETLLQIFSTHNSSYRAQPTDLGTTGAMNWDGVLADAAQMLTPPQLAILETHARLRQRSAAKR